MEKPYRYSIFDTKTGEWSVTNDQPLKHELCTYEPTRNPNVFELKQTKTAYIDGRYSARVRLYNYVTYTKNGIEIPSYDPYKNTEIGKSQPILNF